MSSFDNAVPIVNQPFYYINEMQIKNNATTPNTKFDIGAGICRDSTNTYDINLGNFNGQNNSGTANSSTTVNAAVNGLNGLDTGSLGASKLYYVYVVADAVNGNATGVMCSLASVASGGPLLPFGYNIFRLIGYMFTDGSSHFLLGYNSGNGNARRFTYDAYRATSVTAGTSATYAAIDLSALVPPVNQLPVRFEINWTANAAADVFNMQGANATGDQWTVIAPVAGATAHTVAFGDVLAQLVTGAPKVNYKVSAVGGVAINVASFNYYV
jgi:hypothetical protein